MNQKNEPNWICKYNDEGVLETIYQIIEIHNKYILVETIEYFDLLSCVILNKAPNTEKIIPENITEILTEEVYEKNTKKYRFFYDFRSIIGEFIRMSNQLKKYQN